MRKFCWIVSVSFQLKHSVFYDDSPAQTNSNPAGVVEVNVFANSIFKFLSRLPLRAVVAHSILQPPENGYSPLPAPQVKLHIWIGISSSPQPALASHQLQCG